MKNKKRKIIKIDLSGCKNMDEVNRIVKYFDEGKIKILIDNKHYSYGSILPS